MEPIRNGKKANIWKRSKGSPRNGGADAETLQASVNEYDETVPENIPRLDELQESLDYEGAEEKHGDMFFDHWIDFAAELPGWIKEVRRGYWA
ncbi:hypothetical protein [Selenomonas ruminantium]|uniref:Uncharacterized protein n=1 Tax=Selenomonas ruminantium TaxID=971 RepID=A0A1I0VFC4_SELRU|nr:hypothetical protein [Selenomonas ruminantium]SFA74747.1 hypothetical protein SAMN05216587_101542 [Selenomonas ruminantium]